MRYLMLHHFALYTSKFRQEGWRLEHEDPRDPDSPIVFKGVVFNEMKGVFVSRLLPYCSTVEKTNNHTDHCM